MFEGIPETTIFYDPETRYYGSSTRFLGQHPHHSIVTFDSVDQLLRWCDPHGERIWEEASDADETKLLIARDYKEGTVARGAVCADGRVPYCADDRSRVYSPSSRFAAMGYFCIKVASPR